MIIQLGKSQVAASALESSLLKYSAKEYFFRAALCHLCVDSLNAQHAVQRYEEQFPAFSDSREAKLVKVIYFFVIYLVICGPNSQSIIWCGIFFPVNTNDLKLKLMLFALLTNYCHAALLTKRRWLNIWKMKT